MDIVAIALIYMEYFCHFTASGTKVYLLCLLSQLCIDYAPLHVSLLIRAYPRTFSFSGNNHKRLSDSFSPYNLKQASKLIPKSLCA